MARQSHDRVLLVFGKFFHKLLYAHEIDVIGKGHTDQFVEKFTEIKFAVTVLHGNAFQRELVRVIFADILDNFYQEIRLFPFVFTDRPVMRRQIPEKDV